MKHEIKKLNQLYHIDSFMQINYLRGFKYIDKAGEIVNSFFTGNEEPPYQMTQRELIIKCSYPDSKVYKISVNNIWSHDPSPNNLGAIENGFLKRAREILDILEAKEIVRIGWRNYFVYELQSVKEKNKILSKFLPFTNSNFLNLRFQKSINNLNCTFIIKSVEKKTEDKTPAIIFDIDCSKSFSPALKEIKEISTCLKEIRGILNSESMLDVINIVLNMEIKSNG